MRNLWKSVFGLWMIGLGLGGSVPAQATNAAGPYYATPSWDQTLPASTRFIVLTNMNSEAVLDRETGLVWEQSPSTSAIEWDFTLQHCVRLLKGGRKGWRLPTIQELESLVDPAVASPGPTLPFGHPFGNVQSSYYYSASSFVNGPDFAWGVSFSNGAVNGISVIGANFGWCVRGGQGVDPQ